MPGTPRRSQAPNLSHGNFPKGVGHFQARFAQPPRYRVYGVTRDSAGNTLGGCTVKVYEASPDAESPISHGQLRAETISDANGNYSVDVTGGVEGLTFFAVGYLAGSPDVFGTTANTLAGAEA